MNVPWFAIAVILGLVIVIQEVRILKLKSRIRTLEHYIDKYKDKLESDILEKK